MYVVHDISNWNHSILKGLSYKWKSIHEEVEKTYGIMLFISSSKEDTKHFEVLQIVFYW